MHAVNINCVFVVLTANIAMFLQSPSEILRVVTVVYFIVFKLPPLSECTLMHICIRPTPFDLMHELSNISKRLRGGSTKYIIS